MDATRVAGGARDTWLATLRRHWPEYLMEAAGLGLFMVSAAVFTTLLEHPASPVRQAIDDPTLRRVPMGLAMGLTAIAIVYSPWGQQSGAHLNPALTSTFYRLGKVAACDHAFYCLAQFVGSLLGLALAALVLGDLVAHPAVGYVATVPGFAGTAGAFLAEVAIAFGLMAAVLVLSNSPRWARYTGLAAGALVATYIILEAPLSGMSMNPARSFAPALLAQDWMSLWLYFAAPLLGMLLAAEVYLRRHGQGAVRCAKLHHQNSQRCIFRCGYRDTHS
jgi:aquaporin Z